MTRTHTTDDLVKVAYAHDQVEAEFLQGLLRDVGIVSTVRRAPGFDVPDFLAAGPREVLVSAPDVAAAREVLMTEEEAPPRRDPPRRILAGLLIGLALVVAVVCVALDVFP
jgi:hypothetical protein